MFSLASTLIAVSIVTQALANLIVTQPLSTSQCSATLACNVTWKDDGTSPSLEQIGSVSIDVCTGTQFVQTCLQNIATAYDVSNGNSVTFNPNPPIGPTGQFYFIKFSALTFRDPANPQYLWSQYSPKFTLVGMGGAYNASIIQGSVGMTVATQTLPYTSSSTTTPSGTSTDSSAVTSNPTALVTSASNGAVRIASSHTFATACGCAMVIGAGSFYLGYLVLGF